MSCRQLRPSSQREHVNASNKNVSFKNQPFKSKHSKTVSQRSEKGPVKKQPLFQGQGQRSQRAKNRPEPFPAKIGRGILN